MADAVCDDLPVTVGMTRAGRSAVAGALVSVAALLAGCGDLSLLPGHGDPSGHGVDPAAVAVVKHWSEALRRGDVRTAAGLFQLPSVFANGTAPVQLRTLREAEIVNASLPCGAQYISSVQQGRYLDVLFRLVARQGRGGGAAACGSGLGETARTAFLIRDGKIVQWVRAPSRQGDPGTPTTPDGSGSGSQV